MVSEQALRVGRVELIDKMRSVAPTEVVYCPGNHDFQASTWMHSFLEAH